MNAFKVIADFRKDNGPAIRKVCQQFVALCRDIKLLDGDIIAIDGSWFKAVNSKAKNFTRGKLKQKLGEIDKAIERYPPQSPINVSLVVVDSLGTVDWDDATRLAEKLFVEVKHKNGLSIAPHGRACWFNRCRRCQRRRPCLERSVPCHPPPVGRTIA